MPLGVEVGLGPGYIVLQWDPAPHENGYINPSPSFRSMYGHGRLSQLLLSSCTTGRPVSMHHVVWCVDRQ